MFKNIKRKLSGFTFGGRNKKKKFTLIYLLVGIVIICYAYQVLMNNKNNRGNGYGVIEGLTNKKSLVYFHMNGCGHCKRFMPEWDAFEKSYHGPISVRKVESDEDKALVSSLNISGYPTVLLLDGQNKKLDEFNGERTQKALTEFCKKHA
tara:strand:- start:3773 stop:4222 length:450 start_codon:yes stop_codon:yes gene_type:complete